MRRSIIAPLFLFLILSSCSPSERKNTESLKNIAIEEGNKISLETQKVLGSTLKSVIKSDGIRPAMKYCNVHAYPLVDSLEKKFDVAIKRASTSTRNPKDRADEDEKQIILEYQKVLDAGETPEVFVKVSSDEVHFAKPIILNDQVCLNCHGEIGKDIKTENYDIIKALYPHDNATGHQLGDLRGIWSIRFDKAILSEMEKR